MKVVYVKWDDAAHFDGPVRVEDIDPGFLVETVGVLVSLSKTHVVIAGDICRDIGSKLRDVHTIPRGMIVEMRVSDTDDWSKKRVRR